MPSHCQVLILGAGAAGMMAAIRSAERGRQTILLEKNSKPGVKILMSGGTRCNLTHNTDAAGIVEAFGRPGRFLHSALAAFSPTNVVEFFNNVGVATKVEETGKVFPVSNRALDVQRALRGRVESSGCELRLGEAAESISHSDGRFRVTTPDGIYFAESLVVTTGGKSYPGCGTTGDGYSWAESFGHTIVTTHPALVPITVAAGWATALQGITVPNVHLRIIDKRIENKRKQIMEQHKGSTLFTHFGLSGPTPMNVSRAITRHPTPRDLVVSCDFLPNSTGASLENHWQQLGQSEGSQRVSKELSQHLPARLVAALLEQANLPADQRFADLSRTSRSELVSSAKSATMPVLGTRGYKKAEVTAGGVQLKEVDSRTMESKIVPGLHFAGEILDLDGPIGGYNFQSAFSTGHVAGLHA